jgi:hypothetical protein
VSGCRHVQYRREVAGRPVRHRGASAMDRHGWAVVRAKPTGDVGRGTGQAPFGEEAVADRDRLITDVETDPVVVMWGDRPGTPSSSGRGDCDVERDAKRVGGVSHSGGRQRQ